ncbi:MAG: Mu-like prophage major head subunit gpT family protein [Cypionkella sp.]
MNLHEQIAHARSLIATVTDDLPGDRVRAIEAEHTALLEAIGTEENRRLDAIGAAPKYRTLPAGTRLETYTDDLANKDDEAIVNSTVSNPQADESRAAAIGEALYARLNPSHKVSRAAARYAGLGVPEIARSLLSERQSVSGMSQSDVVTRALGGLHSTSDFGLALQNFAHRVLQDSYAHAPSGLKRIAHQSSARDFRAKSTVRLSGFSELEKVNEHGEFKRGTFGESGETYRVETFGKIFGITRQALVNDDLGVFARTARDMGQKALDFEANFLATLLESNPTMSDSVALFHATHKNLGTPAALSIEALGAARLAMRHQTGLAGELISVAPSFLIVPAELETVAEKILTAIAATKTADVNPFTNLELVVEPRLTAANTWYMAASPSQEVGIEYSYLEGQPGPQIESRQGFDVDGVETRVRLDFGAGVLSHVPLYKNVGAAQPS